MRSDSEPKRTNNGKPTTKFLLDFYDVCLREELIHKQAAALGLSRMGLNKLLHKHKELREAAALANERRGSRSELREYVYQHLSPEAAAIWKELQFWESSDSASDKINAILDGKSDKLRQELFIHALINSNFDPSNACRMVGVSKPQFDRWREDLEFRQLIEEIHWHKKNFFNRSLMKLVEQLHPAAVLFVNKTVNADMGYREQIEVQHSGEVLHSAVNIEELNLDLDTRRKVLAALRSKSLPEPKNIIDLPQIPESATSNG